MPKKSDQLAGGFDSENTGGLLTGLLAEEETIDRRAMFRLGTWGVVSVGAVIVAVLANQSAIKTRRDEVAAIDLTRQSMQITAVARESQNETRRLASAIDTLNSDRDRMYTRLTGVEQGLESVTGAIAKQKVAAASPAASPAPTPPAANQPGPAPQPVAQNAPATEPAPIVSPVATTAAAALAAEKAHADARKPSAPAATVVAAAPTPSPAPSPTPVTTSAMAVVPRSMMAPPDPAAPKMIEAEPPAKPVTSVTAPASSQTPAPSPSAAAAAPAPAPKVTPSPAPVPALVPEKAAAIEKTAPAAMPLSPAPIEVKRTEFGVDVGGANSVAGLRALWRGLLRYRSNAALAALQPIIVVKESNNGLGMQLRLVAGPLSDAAAAARICAAIGSRERSCETTVYDGQRLAIKADDAPAITESMSAKLPPEKLSTDKSSADRSPADRPSSERAPAREATEPAPEKPGAKPGSNKYFHRRGSYVSAKRTAAVAPPPAGEEPPKQESSGLSSFLSSRLHPQAQQ